MWLPTSASGGVLGVARPMIVGPILSALQLTTLSLLFDTS